MKASGAGSNADYDGSAQEVTEKKRISSDLETVLMIFCQRI